MTKDYELTLINILHLHKKAYNNPRSFHHSIKRYTIMIHKALSPIEIYNFNGNRKKA